MKHTKKYNHQNNSKKKYETKQTLLLWGLLQKNTQIFVF